MPLNPRPLRLEEVGGTAGFDPISAFLRPRAMHEELKKAIYDNAVRKAEAGVAEQMKNAELQRALLSNEILTPQAKHAEENFMADLLSKHLGNKGKNLDNQGKEIHLPFMKDELIENLNKLRLGNESTRINNELEGAKVPFASQLAQAEINYKNSRINSLAGRSFSSMPAAEKNLALGQARALGYSNTEASNLLNQGKTLEDLAEAKGFGRDAKEWPSPQHAPTGATLNRYQRSTSALAGVDAVEPFITKAMSPYASRYGNNISPALIKDILLNKNVEKASDALAAYALSPEVAALRVNALGGNVGIEAIRHIEDVSQSILNTLGLKPGSEIYEKTQKKITREIRKMQKAESNAIFGKKEKESSNVLTYNINTGEFE